MKRRIPLRALVGFAAALAAYRGVIRPRLLRWGTTAADATASLPGDNLVVHPKYQTTRAVTIRATPTIVWAWLVQLGQGRGGFYSFDRLENLAWLGIHSADRIVPALQRLAVGDTVPLSGAGGPTVVAVEPGRVLLLRFVMDPFTGRPLEAAPQTRSRWFDWAWAFALQPVAGGSTRLVVRTRADYAPRLLLAPFVAALLEPAHFVMEWGMLRGIKRRAESEMHSELSLRLGAQDQAARNGVARTALARNSSDRRTKS